MQPIVNVEANTLTSLWNHDESYINSVISKRIDTAKMSFDDDGTLDIGNLDELIVWNSDRSARYFAGLVSTYTPDLIGITPKPVCDCKDYTWLLQASEVNAIYENETSVDILADVVNTEIPELDIACLTNSDAIDGTILAADHASLKPSVVSLYAKIEATAYAGLGVQYIIYKAETNKGYSLYFDNTGNIIFTVGDGASEKSAQFDVGDLPAAGSVLEIAGVFDGDNVRIWVNGVEGTADDFGGATTVSNSTRSFSVANDHDGGVPLNGKVWRVMMWSRALTANEGIKKSQGMLISDTDLEIYLAINTGSGATATDQTDNSNDATITSCTWSLPYCQTGLTIKRIAFPRLLGDRVFNRIAGINGYNYYVDYFKRIHFFATEDNPAPFDLSDSPDMAATYPYVLNSYKLDGNKIKNRQTVKGGVEYSDDQDRYYSGDGTRTITNLDYKLHKPDGETGILVWKNTGTEGAPVWTAQSVGVDHINDDDLDDVTYNVLFNYQEKLLKWNTAPPNLNTAIKIHCQIEKPINVRVRSQASYDLYGRWIDAKPIIDTSITTVELAKLRGRQALAEYQFANEVGSLTIDEDGVEAGMNIGITGTLRGITGDYLVHTVRTTFDGNQKAQYKIGFGVYDPDLVDAMFTLRDQNEPYSQTLDTETLNEIFKLPDEGLGIKEDSVTQTNRDTEAYTYGADADEGEYDYATYA